MRGWMDGWIVISISDGPTLVIYDDDDAADADDDAGKKVCRSK